MNSAPQTKQVKPLTLTIFGITGDLSARMLLPALYDLAAQSLLPEPMRIIGVVRRPYTVDELLASIEQAVTQKGGTCDKAVLQRLGQQIELFRMDLHEPNDYAKLRQQLDQTEAQANACMNRLFYIALPPQLFEQVVTQLGEAGLNRGCAHGTGQARLMVEKPFGGDYDSAQALINQVHKHFDEQQIYRIDHFLAKETAQNILTFRFQNSLFRAVWNKHHISRVLVSATETIGIEGRANFYEQTGALRDMVQSHLLQIAALATMDVPDTLTAQSIHDKKLALLNAIEPAKPEQAVRGQYQGYQDEVGNQSSTETYAALQLTINNPRWQGIPILLRTGKALAQKSTDITIVFTDHDDRTIDNTLTLQLAPNEGISLHLRAKKPGLEHDMQNVVMNFSYNDSFAKHRQPSAYERVLIDAFRGDRTLFATSDQILASWRILQPLLQAWQTAGSDLQTYAKGSEGPKAGKTTFGLEE